MNAALPLDKVLPNANAFAPEDHLQFHTAIRLKQPNVIEKYFNPFSCLVQDIFQEKNLKLFCKNFKQPCVRPACAEAVNKNTNVNRFGFDLGNAHNGVRNRSAC